MGIDVENISLPKFEKEKYLEHGKKTYEMREEVEKIADEDLQRERRILF